MVESGAQAHVEEEDQTSPMAEPGYIVGIDTGGTFTDVALLTAHGDLVMGKSATTPHDFSVGVMNALAEVAQQMSLSLEELLGRTSVFKHGTTVATNALITRSGSRVGLITTRGFEDTTLIMRAIGRVDGLPEEEVRHVTAVTKPQPLVPRELVRGVTERVDYLGSVVDPLDLGEVDAAIEDLVEREACTAVAVSLLHAWANPDHENAVRERVRSRGADRQVYWSFGSDLSKVAGEYARANTAIANSFVGPTVDRYLTDLEHKLETTGLHGPFLVMQGTGGVSSRAASTPIGILQSGPAGGMIASAYMANLLGHRKVLTADMGGTSFDVSLVTDGVWPYAEEPIFERFRLLQPIADVQSIGAGGGTIARVDPVTGRLLVGPQSAGASPGPVCYDAGGEQVTVTDADLLLGYLDPDYFLGGRRALNKAKAEAVVRETLANPLGMGITEAAAGVYEIVNSKMSDLIRRQVVRSGHLPEEFVLYAFGGAGPVHAVAYARELGIDAIHVFPTSAVHSAFGAATADVLHSRVATFQALLPFEPSVLNQRLEEIEQELARLMDGEGFPAERVSFRRYVSMRFRRQTYGVQVVLPWARVDAERVRELQRLFEQRYEELYGAGSAFTIAGVEIHTLRVDAVGPVVKPRLSWVDERPSDGSAALKATRRAYFDDGWRETSVYDSTRLEPGAALRGPAIVEAPLTSIVVPPSHSAFVDGYRNLVIRTQESPNGYRHGS
jgi:N-methylhydantoinase A